jgi:hypothetical protein
MHERFRQNWPIGALEECEQLLWAVNRQQLLAYSVEKVESSAAKTSLKLTRSEHRQEKPSQ